MTHDPVFHPWQAILEDTHASLVRSAAGVDSSSPTEVERLRRGWSVDLVAAALQLVQARRKAAEKFGHAEQLLADTVGVEQATSLDVARHKAGRFAEHGVGRVLDLCSGIGGDAIALAEVADVLAVEVDPVRALMTRQNVMAMTGHTPSLAVADVTTLRVSGGVFHIDPSRRKGVKRCRRIEDYQPGPAFYPHLIRQTQGGAIKLGPGVDLAALPPGEVEFISRGGQLVQAVLWTGTMARRTRTATRVPGGHELTGQPGEPPIGPAGRYLFTVDPAVERAELLGELCDRLNLTAIHPSLGLLTADHVVDSPWLTPFQLIESMPWREGRVRGWLGAHGAGIVEVKTRGGAVNPDVVQRRLRGDGQQAFTVFILRHGRPIRVWITRRVSRPQT